MAEIKTGTLIVAIQAVAAQVRVLQEAAQSGEAALEELELLSDWQGAAEDLEAAYDKLALTQLNLPPYDELVAG